MSLIPIVFRDWWVDLLDEPLRTSRLLDQHFGCEIDLEDLLTALTTVAPTLSQEGHRRRKLRRKKQWRKQQKSASSDSEHSSDATDSFQIKLDVQQFTPEDLSVTASGNCITVEGKHEEHPDEHGFVKRHFVWRYVLPEGHDLAKIESSLSSDGILLVCAPKKEEFELIPEANEQRQVQLVEAGQVLSKEDISKGCQI